MCFPKDYLSSNINPKNLFRVLCGRALPRMRISDAVLTFFLLERIEYGDLSTLKESLLGHIQCLILES